MKISKRDALMWYSFLAQLPEDEPLMPRQQELALAVLSQIELAQLSTEMGQSLQGATQLVNTYKRDMPSFTGFVRDFMKTIAPMNEALNGGLDEMTDALDQLCGCTLEGVYAEADLDALIEGAVPTIQPILPEKPVVQTTQPVAPHGQPATQGMSLLDSIERGMPAFDPNAHV